MTTPIPPARWTELHSCHSARLANGLLTLEVWYEEAAYRVKVGNRRLKPGFVSVGDAKKAAIRAAHRAVTELLQSLNELEPFLGLGVTDPAFPAEILRTMNSIFGGLSRDVRITTEKGQRSIVTPPPKSAGQ